MTAFRRAIPALAATFAATWAPSLAVAGQVIIQDAPLAAVVARSGLALLVTVEAPGAVRVDYPVPPAGTKPCEPYSSSAWRVRVERVLAPARFPAAAVGDRLTVIPADVPDLVGISHRACLDGTSKSPIFERFGGAEPRSGARLLVLLTWLDGYGWTEATSGSWLLPSQLPRLQAVMKGKMRVGSALDVTDPSQPGRDAICLDDGDCTLATLQCGPCGACPGQEGVPVHRQAAQRFAAACAQSHAPPSRPRRGPPVQAPNCAPCPAPTPPPARAPRAVCEKPALRCGVAR